MSLKTIVNRILKLDAIFAGISVTLLIGITFFGVFARYLFNSPFTWLEEVQMFLILWTVFLGGSVAVRDHGHVAITFIVDMLPESLQKIVDVLIFIVMAIVMYFVAINAIDLILLYIRSNRVTNLLNIPYQLIYFVVPLGCLLIVINYLLQVLEHLFGIEILEKEAN